MMPDEDSTPNNPELKVDLDHLDPETAEAFSSMKAKYPNLYSTHKHHVGLFSGWAAKAIINTAINCRQKQRGRFLPQTAKEDLDRYFKARVFVISQGGADSHVCNITLTRPQQKEQKFSTKADKNLQKKMKRNAKSMTSTTVKTQLQVKTKSSIV